MRKRIWIIRLLMSTVMIITSAIISLFFSNSFIINFMNTSFLLALSFMVISGLSYVIINGFFNIFVLGWKRIFSKDDLTVDRSHWSYDKKDENNSERELLRKNAKKELFIYIPLSIGIILFVISIIILSVY